MPPRCESAHEEIEPKLSANQLDFQTSRNPRPAPSNPPMMRPIIWGQYSISPPSEDAARRSARVPEHVLEALQSRFAGGAVAALQSGAEHARRLDGAVME